MMRKYRISYDRHLVAKGNNNEMADGFDYKGEHIMGIALYVEISAFDNGREVLFTAENDEEMTERTFDFGLPQYNPVFGSYLSNALKFFVDRNSECGYRMEMSDVAKMSRFDFKFKADGGCKWSGGWGNPVEISNEEFSDILINNIDRFDNADNKPAQNCSYSTNEVVGDEKI